MRGLPYPWRSSASGVANLSRGKFCRGEDAVRNGIYVYSPIVGRLKGVVIAVRLQYKSGVNFTFTARTATMATDGAKHLHAAYPDRDEARWWDLTGIAASGLCIVHCLATPVLLLALPAVGWTWLEHPLVHQLLAVLAVVVALAGIAPSFFLHRRMSVISFAVLGLSAVLYAAFWYGPMYGYCSELAGTSAGSAWSLAGGGSLIVAHILNFNATACCPR